MGLFDDEQLIPLDALDHGEVDEGQDVHGGFVNDGLNKMVR